MSHEALRVAKFGATIWHTLKIRKPEMKGFNTNKISSSPYSFLSTDSKVNKQKCSKLSRKFNATCYIFCCNFLLSHALIKITVKRTLSSQTMTWVLDQNQAAEMKLMGTEFSWPKIINISRVAQSKPQNVDYYVATFQTNQHQHNNELGIQTLPKMSINDFLKRCPAARLYVATKNY